MAYVLCMPAIILRNTHDQKQNSNQTTAEPKEMQSQTVCVRLHTSANNVQLTTEQNKKKCNISFSNGSVCPIIPFPQCTEHFNVSVYRQTAITVISYSVVFNLFFFFCANNVSLLNYNFNASTVTYMHYLDGIYLNLNTFSWFFFFLLLLCSSLLLRTSNK